MSGPRRSRREGRFGRLATGSALLGALAAASIGVNTGTGSPASAATVAGSGLSWRVELDPAKGQQSNLSRVGNALTVRGGVRTRAAADGGTSARGTYLAPAIATGRLVGAVRVQRSSQVPAGAEVAVDVRGRDGRGAWTQWREPDPSGVVRLPRPVSLLQTRLTLLGSSDGRVPTVSALSLRSSRCPPSRRPPPRRLPPSRRPTRCSPHGKAWSAPPPRTVTSSSAETTSSRCRPGTCSPRPGAVPRRRHLLGCPEDG